MFLLIENKFYFASIFCCSAACVLILSEELYSLSHPLLHNVCLRIHLEQILGSAVPQTISSTMYYSAKTLEWSSYMYLFR